MPRKQKRSRNTTEVVCANCGKEFEQSDLAAWAQVILKHQPACSYECNKALGQTAD